MTDRTHLLVNSHVGRSTEDLANGVMFCSRQGKATTAIANVQTPKNSRAELTDGGPKDTSRQKTESVPRFVE